MIVDEKSPIFAAEIPRELSSVGSEHRPYKAGVVGSSPTVPTKKMAANAAIFLVISCSVVQLAVNG